MIVKKIDQDLITAMKEKNEIATNCLRMLKSAIRYEAIHQKKDSIDESEIIAIVRRALKQRKESQEAFTKGNRPDLAQKEAKEIDLISAYLPAGLSEEALKKVIQDAINATGAKTKADKGKVMKEVVAKVRGQADGSQISQFVDQFLS